MSLRQPVQLQDRSLGLLDGQRRTPRSKPLVLRSASAQRTVTPQRATSRCSSRGPLGNYHATSSDDDDDAQMHLSARLANAGSHRFSSLTYQQQMGFYQLKHPERASQDSSPESSPLQTPYGSVEKLKSNKDQQVDYLFPLPPIKSDKAQETDATFLGLGLLDGVVAQDSREAPVTTPLPNRADATAFAPDLYDSDGLTGSQGWSPSTYAPSVCPSPLQHSPSLGSHSRTASFTQPLSIRKTSGMPPSIIDHGDADASFHAEDSHKLARLQSSLALLGLQQEEDLDEGNASEDAASESSPRLRTASTPLTTSLHLTHSPEHGAPSLAEQMAFASGSGSGFGYDMQEGLAHYDSSFDYLSPWLRERLEQCRRDSMHSEESMGLNPLSGIQAETGDSWTEAHGTQLSDGEALSRQTSRSNRTSVYTSTASASPIMTGPMAAQEPATTSMKLMKPRLSLSPHLNLLSEFSYMALFGDSDPVEVQAHTAVANNQPASAKAPLFSPPLSTPELEKQCQGDLSFSALDSFPSPVVARPTSIGMKPFAFDLGDQPKSSIRPGLSASKSMFDLHARSSLQEDALEEDEASAVQAPPTLPAATSMASMTSVLNRGRPIRQCGYLQRSADVITITRHRPALTTQPRRPSGSPPKVPNRISSMGKDQVSPAAAVRKAYFEKSKVDEFVAKAELDGGRSTPTQLIPGHRNSGSKSMLSFDRDMLFASSQSSTSHDDLSAAVDRLQEAGRPRTLSREASEAMKLAKLESAAAGSKKQLPKSASSTSAKPLFSTSIFKRQTASSASQLKASRSMADLQSTEVGPKNEVVTDEVAPAKASPKSAKVTKTKAEPKAPGKSFMSRCRTKSFGASGAAAAMSKSASAKDISAPLAPARSQTEPVVQSASDDMEVLEEPVQLWQVKRPSVNSCGYLRSPAQDSAIFPASHSMPVVFVARTGSQRRRGETGIMETTPSPLLPSHFRSENGRARRATRWSSAKALADSSRLIEEDDEDDEQRERLSSLPAPSGCVLVVEERKVTEERHM